MELFSFIFGMFFMASTPGPNNIILLTISSNYGYKKALPYVLGSFSMGIIMIIAITLGLSEIFKLYPLVEQFLAWFGFSFMFYLAIKIILSKKRKIKEKKINKPFGFTYAFLFQLMNPKTWIANLIFTARYIDLVNFSLIDYFLLPLILSGMGFIGGLIWIFAGSILSKLIKDDFWGEVLNWIMGILLMYLGVSFVIPYIF